MQLVGTPSSWACSSSHVTHVHDHQLEVVLKIRNVYVAVRASDAPVWPGSAAPYLHVRVQEHSTSV